MLALGSRVRSAYPIPASDILVTKTMLGVFGCVPAFDRFFRIGFGVSAFRREALAGIGQYYEVNRAVLDAIKIPTLDFETGQDMRRDYTSAKIIDMIFYEEGRKRRSGIVGF